MNALEISAVSKNFATMRAIDQLSFQVHSGEIFAMLGPNGAGKTTTLNSTLKGEDLCSFVTV